MASALDTAEQVHCETRAQWRAWLAEHHTQPRGVWLVSWRTATGRPAVGYEPSVEEALCFGWVDSVARRLDDDRTMLYFAPRKKGSGWARTNKDRVARLEAAGLMADAGRAVVDAARADGSWTLLDDVENLVVPDDLAAAFDRHPGSRERWDAFPRSARRGMLEWLVQARTAPTRERRLERIAEGAARGERAL